MDAARGTTAQEVRNQGAKRARESEVVQLPQNHTPVLISSKNYHVTQVASHNNAWNELAQVCKCLTCFREWICLGLPALLKCFDSIVAKGKGTP